MTSATDARPDTAEVADRLEVHRRELMGFCYRMLGSPFDAEDAVQDTMVRAWRGATRFDGRSSLRTWLYRIATNVCLDMIESRGKRALPIDLGPSGAPVQEALGEPLSDATWLAPIPDALVVPDNADPAELAVARESVRLAFVWALQHLPPRQRAVLILKEVLAWKADEIAELLGTSTAAVNSALQRARAALDDRLGTYPAHALDRMDERQQVLLDRYVSAFERYDIESLVALLREDATQTMPPYELWLRGAADIGRWHLGPGIGCRGSRLIPVRACGLPAFASYRPSGPGGRHEPFSIQILEVEGGEIVRLTHFLDPALFPLFGLPLTLEGEDAGESGESHDVA